MEEILKLFSRRPVRVFRENGLNLVGAEAREVHLTYAAVHIKEGAVCERRAGCRSEDGGVMRRGRVVMVMVVMVMVVLRVRGEKWSSMSKGHWEKVTCVREGGEGGGRERERKRGGRETVTQAPVSLHIVCK